MMKNLQEYLTESQQYLYHYTDAYSIIGICKEDKFECFQENGKYIMSTTRQKNALTGYPTGTIAPQNKLVRIVLDGRKLNSKYKIKSHDYFPGSKYIFTHDPLQTNIELEDRVYSGAETIPAFHKYILEIQLQEEIEEVKQYCEKYNIIYTVLSEKKWLCPKS